MFCHMDVFENILLEILVHDGYDRIRVAFCLRQPYIHLRHILLHDDQKSRADLLVTQNKQLKAMKIDELSLRWTEEGISYSLTRFQIELLI